MQPTQSGARRPRRHGRRWLDLEQHRPGEGCASLRIECAALVITQPQAGTGHDLLTALIEDSTLGIDEHQLLFHDHPGCEGSTVRGSRSTSSGRTDEEGERASGVQATLAHAQSQLRVTHEMLGHTVGLTVRSDLENRYAVVG